MNLTKYALLMGLTNASQLFIDCKACYDYGGRQCLFDGDYKHATCCDMNASVRKSPYCRFSQHRNTFCASSSTHSNPILKNWTCQMNTNKCPHDYVVTIDGIQKVERSYTWNEIVPQEAAKDWNCKYHVSLSEKMYKDYTSWDNEGDDKKELGYLMVQVEQYGFDEEVSIIVQPRFEFYDVGSDKIPQGKITAVNQAAFGERFLVPADHDILINFAPTAVYPERKIKKSYMGRFKLRAWYQEQITEEDKANKKAIIYWKPGQEEERTYPEPIKPEPKPEEKEKEEEKPKEKETKPEDNSKSEEQKNAEENQKDKTEGSSGKPLPEPEKNPEEEAKEEKEYIQMSEEERNSSKVSWTGEVIKDDEPWYDKKLFNIADFQVTSGDVAKTSGAVFIIIGIITGICMAITFRKRHKIAHEIRRLSSKVRASLKGRPMQEFVPDEIVDVKKITKNKNQREFLNDLFAEQNNKEDIEKHRSSSKVGRRENAYAEINHDTIEGKDESGFDINQQLEDHQDKQRSKTVSKKSSTLFQPENKESDLAQKTFNNSNIN